jgi:2-polyprenyl-3-methyl-5-hydroxy-6-metoxy-1,4-benzoquinol methylase
MKPHGQASGVPLLARSGAGARAVATPVDQPRIGVLIVAYHAASTLSWVLDRIPARALDRIAEIAVFDDASTDDTYELAVTYRQARGMDKLAVIKNPHNLGYGGNQKAGYTYFAERGIDVVVLLHGDGQYAPEILDRLYEPIVRGEADAVFGSRMLRGRLAALRGGMPLYKLTGNRILTAFENRALHMNLSEFHSGYRAYSLRALEQIDLSTMTDGFHFDTQIIVKLQHQGMRIAEVPIPTYYGDEICRVEGIRYARDVVAAVSRYRRTRSGGARAPEFAEYFPRYPLKDTPGSSHTIALTLAGAGRRVLDIGCGDGELAARLAAEGHEVFGIDALEAPAHREALAGYGQADLARGLDGVPAADRLFDTILMLDVLEHLAEPEQILADARARLAPGGVAIVSLPNVANITVRLALLRGRFPYADRGILDRSHMRFFTRSSARALLSRCGFEVVEQTDAVMPVELLLGLSDRRTPARITNRVLRTLTPLAPGLLSYQTVLAARAAGRDDG